MKSSTPISSRALANGARDLCLEKRAEDVVTLDVRGLVDYMDYLVIASGRSERQNQAIAENVVRGSKRLGVIPLSTAGRDVGNWVCIDLVDVVVHVFTPEMRALYDLELLWGDAPRFESALPDPEPEPASEPPAEKGPERKPRKAAGGSGAKGTSKPKARKAPADAPEEATG